MTNERRNLGCGFWYSFMQFAPDRELNPQYEDIPDFQCGIIIWRIESREEGMVSYDPEHDPFPDTIWRAVAAPYFDIPENHSVFAASKSKVEESGQTYR